MNVVCMKLVSSRSLSFVIALFCAIGIWKISEKRQILYKQYPVVCAFYGEGSQHVVVYPDSIEVLLQGSRLALRTLGKGPLIAHVDVDRYGRGCQPLILTEATLFLPPGIKLVNWSPAQASVTFGEKAE